MKKEYYFNKGQKRLLSNHSFLHNYIILISQLWHFFPIILVISGAQRVYEIWLGDFFFFLKMSCFFSLIMLTLPSNLFYLSALLLLYSQEVQSISILHLHLLCVNKKTALGSRGHDFNKINQNDVLTHSLVLKFG